MNTFGPTIPTISSCWSFLYFAEENVIQMGNFVSRSVAIAFSSSHRLLTPSNSQDSKENCATESEDKDEYLPDAFGYFRIQF